MAVNTATSAEAEKPGTASPEVTPEVRPWSVSIALKLIKIYQHYLSPLTPPSCRFYPTCSCYTYQAIARFGLARGVWLGLKRLCKCHPFHPGGDDPVPMSPIPVSQPAFGPASQQENANRAAVAASASAKKI